MAVPMLADRASSRTNNFDVLRLLAATLVLVSHSFALVGLGEPHLGSSSLGVVGVEIFFAISGFLVVKSWLSQPQLGAFLLKRALRIVPALVVCVVASAYLLGTLVTSQPVADYLLSAEPVRYVVETMLAVGSGGAVGHIPYELPGVFAGNPHGTVNGSLWTLPVEVRAYYVLAGLALLGLLRRWFPLVAAAGLVLCVVMGTGLELPLVGALDERPAAQRETVLLLAIFAAGVLLYVERRRVPLSAPLACAALAAWLGLSFTPLSAAAAVVALPYVVLFAAYRTSPWLGRLTRGGDVSYGLYLFAFPVAQVVVELGGSGLSGWGAAGLTFVATYALAFASWKLVEAPALRLKRHIGRLQRPDALERLRDEAPAHAPAAP
jgi:peptidoglycan/LPS O-acetylase OafA/YrhL